LSEPPLDFSSITCSPDPAASPRRYRIAARYLCYSWRR
jgi:hypothetical protein